MNRYANGLFGGGGIQGIGHLGAVRVAEELGWRWRRLAGTSVGALCAALLAAGYSGAELQRLMLEANLLRFVDGIGWPPGGNLWRKHGLCRGNYLLRWTSDRLRERGVTTFADLSIPLQIVAVDLTYKRLLVFPDDLALPPYRFANPLAFPVAQAVRASAGMPFLYDPVYLDVPGGGRVTLVDGGLLSNFPVTLFRPGEAEPQFPTIGFRLVGPADGVTEPTDTLVQYCAAVIDTVAEGWDNTDEQNQDYERSIGINTGPYSPVQFNLDQRGKEWLFQSGEQGARAFFADPAIIAWLHRFPGIHLTLPAPS